MSEMMTVEKIQLSFLNKLIHGPRFLLFPVAQRKNFPVLRCLSSTISANPEHPSSAWGRGSRSQKVTGPGLMTPASQ